VIILGITDEIPREIVSIDDLENRKKSIKSTIRNYINIDYNFIVLQEVKLEDNKKCLVIVIAQTKAAIEVRGLNNMYSYPIRLETGLEKIDKSKIQKQKEDVLQNNFDFIINLKEFVKE